MSLCMLLVLVMCFAPGVTWARTWRVEKNGAGDYGVVQDALDVAASGDTILVGIGRFDEQHIIGNPPWQQNACGHVSQARITIKGVEGGGSIIGPAGPWDASQGQDYGLYISVNLDAADAVIEDVEICGVYIGVKADAETVQLSRCRFSNCSQSILYTSGVAEIRDTHFDSLADGSSTHVLATGGSRLVIDRCDFEIESPPRTPKSHIHVESTAEATVMGCTVRGGTIGAVVTAGANATFSGCHFVGQSKFGVTLSGRRADLIDCELANQEIALYQYGAAGIWNIDRTQVVGVRTCTLKYILMGGGSIRNSTLAKGERYVVMDGNATAIDLDAPITLDMTNNWWGTADPDSIQAWIFDSSDQPARPYYYIAWGPFRSEPLPVKKQSLGSTKAMFR